MNLTFLFGLWQALRILPVTAKGLLVAGYILSGVIYWSATIATPGPNAQCLAGLCIVTPDQVQATKIMGIALIGGITAMFVLSLVLISIAMEKHPERVRKLMGPVFDGVSTSQFWNRISNTPIGKSLSSRVKLALILLWIFNIFVWGFLLPSVNPDSFVFFLFAGGCVTLGSVFITAGTLGSKWLQ